MQASLARNKKPYIDKDEWVRLVRNDLEGSRSAIINTNLDAIVEVVKLYIDLSNHERNWKNPLPTDFFADRDWFAEGKNIWIIQVGNNAEYGSYDEFKNRVIRAKIEMDDVGDMECIYHMPKPDGSSQALSLKYKDECQLDGTTFQTDLYPRFENPFIRGVVVEWGQREYVIEYRGDETRPYKSLRHDFSDLTDPTREENEAVAPEQLDTIKALVIHITTGDESMGLFSVAQASVKVGCVEVASDEIVAAGEVDEGTTHDAEWIFFDTTALLTPDMAIEIEHPATSDGLDDPEWKMSYSLKALMGDRRLYDCSISFPGCHFVDGRRSTGPVPFTVQLSRWRTWQMLDETSYEFWQIASRPGWDSYYYDYLDLLAIDINKRLWHRRVEACPGPKSEWKAVCTTGPSMLFKEPPSVCSISTGPGNLFLFVMNKGELFNCFASPGEDVSDKKWERLKPETIPTAILGIPIPNAAPVLVPLFAQTQIVAKVSDDGLFGLSLYLSGADGSFYSRASWRPDSQRPWRQIDTDSVFTPLAGAPFEVCSGHLFALDDHRRLWVGAIDDSDVKVIPSWKQLTDDLTNITNFTVAQKGAVFTILISTIRGEIKAAAFSSPESPVFWERVGEASNFLAIVGAKLAWAIPREGHLDIFTAGADGKIYTTYWEAQAGWEKDHDWNIIDPNGHHFEVSAKGGMFTVNRVNNQIEIFSSSTDNQIWKTWWT
jgi:hypothetical protein